MVRLVAMGVAGIEPFDVVLGNFVKVNVCPLRNLAEVPEHVAHFLHNRIMIHALAVERVVLDQINDLARFTSQAQGTVG